MSRGRILATRGQQRHRYHCTLHLSLLFSALMPISAEQRSINAPGGSRVAHARHGMAGWDVWCSAAGCIYVSAFSFVEPRSSCTRFLERASHGSSLSLYIASTCHLSASAYTSEICTMPGAGATTKAQQAENALARQTWAGGRRDGAPLPALPSLLP